MITLTSTWKEVKKKKLRKVSYIGFSSSDGGKKSDFEDYSKDKYVTTKLTSEHVYKTKTSNVQLT